MNLAVNPQCKTEIPDSYIEWARTTIPNSWSLESDYIRVIGEHLDAVTRGEIDRLAIHMPPRHRKTETVTVRYPVYRMLREPGSNYLITGYNERFARRLGRKSKMVAAPFVQFAPEKKAADEWETIEGSSIMARGVGSPPTGVGFSGILIDDPIRKREDAESEAYREKTWDWYLDDLYTRLEPGGFICLVMTLWSHDDIGARAIASEPGKWTVLKLPALALENDPMGRSPGDALWPEKWSVEELERRRDVMIQKEGANSWEALYQQNPTPREGAFFHPDKIETVEVVPAGLRKCRAWDAGATAGGGDFSVGLRLEGPDKEGFWYITDVERGQWDVSSRDTKMRRCAEFDGREARVRVPQDPGAAGKAQVAAWVRLLAGFNVLPEVVSGDKETRAAPVAAQCNAGTLKMVKAPWNAVLREELRLFPYGAHDDQVDALADAFNDLSVSTSSWGGVAWV